MGRFLEQVSATGCKGSHRQLPPSHLRQAQPTQGLRSHASGCLTGPDCFTGKPGTRRRHRGSVPLGACIPFPRQAASHSQNHRRSAVVRATVQCRHTAAALLWRCAPQHRIPPRSCRQTGRAGEWNGYKSRPTAMGPACHCISRGGPERPYSCNGSWLQRPSWTTEGPWEPAPVVHDGAGDAVGFRPIRQDAAAIYLIGDKRA